MIVLLALFVSCRQPKPLAYQGVSHLGMSDIGLTYSTVSMDMKLYNPNNYKMNLKSAAVDVYFDGKMVGKAIVNKSFTIPRKDTFELPVLLRVDLANVFPNALQLLMNKQITLKLCGEMRAGKHGVCINIPVNYEGVQKFR